jgi:hypothetical protein
MAPDSDVTREMVASPEMLAIFALRLETVSASSGVP